MDDTRPHTPAEICSRMMAQQLPRWHELPDLELYMDQVLALIARYLDGYPGFDDKPLTASMVNNYVKHGVMPPPVKKKYTRTHLAHLVMICSLKPVMPIAVISRLITDGLSAPDRDTFYDSFCDLFEETARQSARYVLDQQTADSGRPTALLMRCALRARAEQALGLQLAAALTGPSDAAGRD